MVTKVYVFFCLFFYQTSFADLPINNLKRPIDLCSTRATMTETDFNKIIDTIASKFTPIIKKHGADLIVEKDWASPDVNAFAFKIDTNKWAISFFGGLARHEYMTEDGFAYVACHEIGHHIGGHYFYSNSDTAAEGSADYFAAQSCLRQLWINEKDQNSKAIKSAPESLRIACQEQWSTKEDQNLCARIAMAGMPLAQVTGEVYGDPLANFDSPDTTSVTFTDTSHPHAQCRLDTALAAALCKKEFNLDIIPGIDLPDNNSVQAEQLAFQYSCSNFNGDLIGQRPKCWFKEQSEPN